MASRIPIMTITTSTSIRLNPLVAGDVPEQLDIGRFRLECLALFFVLRLGNSAKGNIHARSVNPVKRVIGGKSPCLSNKHSVRRNPIERHWLTDNLITNYYICFLSYPERYHVGLLVRKSATSNHVMYKNNF